MACVGDVIKSAINSAAVAFETAWGDVGTYVAPSGNVDVALTAGGVNGDVTQILGVRANRDKRSFWVSTQPNWPPAGGPNVKCQMLYRGQYWQIQNTVNDDGIGLRYELQCVLTTGLSVQA